MRKLGYYLHKTSNGYLLVKIINPKRIPKLYSKVFNSKWDFIGYLIDIIGPVHGPYAVIKPVKDIEPSPHEPMYYKR